MAKRCGAVVVFKDGVTQAEAIAALKTIKHLLDVPTEITDYSKTEIRDGQRWAVPVKRPYSGKDLVKEFDNEYGGPVWYIP